MRGAFPDLLVVHHEAVMDADRVATRFSMSGTVDVAELGARAFSIDGMDLFLLRDGKIERINAYFDTQAFAEQVGQGTEP